MSYRKWPNQEVLYWWDQQSCFLCSRK